jgi:hypothetical protein
MVERATYTLWRGQTLLGRFKERKPADSRGSVLTVAGVLEPAVESSMLESLHQSRVSLFPGRPILQYPLPALPLGPQRESTHSDSSPAVGAWGVTNERIVGVPPEKILRVETERGVSVDADAVSLRLSIISDAVDPVEFRRANGLGGASRDIWMVRYDRVFKPSQLIEVW